MKILGNPPSNLLILFLEKGVRSKNHCPDEEGIKTYHYRHLQQMEHVRTIALMKKGLRLKISQGLILPSVRTIALMKKGLRQGALKSSSNSS